MRLAFGAQPRQRDVGIRDAGAFHKPAVGFGQIYMGFTGDWVSPYDVVEREGSFGKFSHHFVAHLKAALAD